MGVKVLIHMKGASKKVLQAAFEYPFPAGAEVTAGEFVNETVRITLQNYLKAATDTSADPSVSIRSAGDPSAYARTAAAAQMAAMLQVLPEEEIREKAAEGKIAFGVHYNSHTVSLEKAQENAVQCFKDGLVALFVDGQRYENMEDSFIIRESSEVSFIKLTFLAGRMW